jgi:cyclic beta-1,2-glucan synthetase
MNPKTLTSDQQECNPSELRAAGAAFAASIPFQGRRATRPGNPAKPSYRQRALACNASVPSRRLLIEDMRLISSAEKEDREFAAGFRRLPLVRDASGKEVLRASALAKAYLDACRNNLIEEACVAFLLGFQDVAVLEMSEIWAFKPALQRELLERIATSPADWAGLLFSLRQMSKISWKELFEAVNRIDQVLASDPIDAYRPMEFESRGKYRDTIGGLARYSSISELEIAEAALTLARRAHTAGDGSRAAIRRAHVGYYLVDNGLQQLKAAIGYRPPFQERIKAGMLRSPEAFYLSGIEIVACLVTAAMLIAVDSRMSFFIGLLLLLAPTAQVAVNLMSSLVTFLLPPRTLPRLDFSKGIPADCATMVAVPTLLLNEAQVRDLVLNLEIHALANRDPQIYFALLTDCPDSDQKRDERDRLVILCTELIESLNRRYSGSPFFLLHRERVFNEGEGRWMGWERKRGKLLDFNRLVRGGFDSFPIKVGDLSVLPGIRFVITLDSDTQLPRDSASRLIGTLAHPLNAAVIDHARHIVVEGYGILQPRIGVSIHSAARSRLAAFYSGETGFDIYTRAVSDVYQDLFGEGIFTGKGIYEVDVLRAVLEQRFPENALLSHDLIEGAYARAALVSDIELIDDYPSHFGAYSRRKHRWVRGDWQTLWWLGRRVPDRALRMAPNPISIISRWKILDNLRRSLLELSTVVLFLFAWFALPMAGYWTLAAVAMIFFPAYLGVLFSLVRAPQWISGIRGWARNTWKGFAEAHINALITLIFLLHQALVSTDAIVRSVLRMFVTGRKLLEWETAAEAEAATKSKATVDIYLEWTPILSLVIGLLVWRLRPHALLAAAPILLLWGSSLAVSVWLNRSPRTANRALRRTETDRCCEYGEKIWRFFRDWSLPSTNWLIPDNLREDGQVDLRLSPTNLGMLLNARIAAVHFGFITLAEFAFDTAESLQRVLALPKHRGHLLNWYDISTLEPMDPAFISTVDSGNLAACLWTLKQAALAFAGEPPAKRGLTPEIAAGLSKIAATCDRLVREMDFRFLYDSRTKLMAVGFSLDSGETTPSAYDLLASEARIACFIAIAKGDIPQAAWFHLNRAHTLLSGETILISWTGTMFEYLMPTIWMHHYPGTITANSIRGVVKAQREYARRKGIPWGISESAFLMEDGSYGYAPFGIPDLAMKRRDDSELVVSPYATFLAVAVDPSAALRNLEQIEEYGWTGRYGFYEAIDYTHSGGAPLRSWMAHHQGMSLLSLCNLLFDQPLQRYFHAEPHVLATELLLHERIPVAMQTDKEEFPALEAVSITA